MRRKKKKSSTALTSFMTQEHTTRYFVAFNLNIRFIFICTLDFVYLVRLTLQPFLLVLVSQTAKRKLFLEKHFKKEITKQFFLIIYISIRIIIFI